MDQPLQNMLGVLIQELSSIHAPIIKFRMFPLAGLVYSLSYVAQNTGTIFEDFANVATGKATFW